MVNQEEVDSCYHFSCSELFHDGVPLPRPLGFVPADHFQWRHQESVEAVDYSRIRRLLHGTHDLNDNDFIFKVLAFNRTRWDYRHS